MEAIANFSGNWLEIAAAIYILGMILYGHHKGFIRLAISASAMVITLISVHIAMPYVTSWLKECTPVYEKMQDNMEETIGLDSLVERFGSDGKTQKEDEWMIIEELPIPEQIKQLLVENNNIEVYDQMNVELFEDYITGYLTHTIMRTIIFLALFVLIYLTIRFVVVWLDLIAKLPILSGINQITGAILGAVESMVVVWICCVALTAVSGTEIGATALQMVSASSWLSWLYDHNILSAFVFGMFRGI